MTNEKRSLDAIESARKATKNAQRYDLVESAAAIAYALLSVANHLEDLRRQMQERR